MGFLMQFEHFQALSKTCILIVKRKMIALMHSIYNTGPKYLERPTLSKIHTNVAMIHHIDTSYSP